METNINALSAPAQNFRVEENQFIKESKSEQKKKKVYAAKAAVAKKEGGKARRLSAAILVIFIGLIFLARNFGILEFNFIEGLLMVWPLAVIIIGICIAAKDGWWSVGLAAATLAVISIMAIMLAKGYFGQNQKSQIIESDNGIIFEQNIPPTLF